MFNFTKPVLLIAFRRPDLARDQLAILARVQPPRLYIALDAPRPDRPAEVEASKSVQRVFETIPWLCETRRNYAESNLGCGRRVSSAITWFLEQETDGIILEDDCLPDQSFFHFCEELLDRYRDDPRVMSVSGCLGEPESKPIRESYFFSKYTRIWGWATWRRAWQLYDYNFARWNEYKRSKAFRKKCFHRQEREYWTKAARMVTDRIVDTWDYQWWLDCWMNDGLTAVARVNMVTNDGFGRDSTHTTAEFHGHLKHESSPLEFPLVHPAEVTANRQLDYEYWNYALRPLDLLARIRRKLSTIRWLRLPRHAATPSVAS
jgi:hypothetical protein